MSAKARRTPHCHACSAAAQSTLRSWAIGGRCVLYVSSDMGLLLGTVTLPFTCARVVPTGSSLQCVCPPRGRRGAHVSAQYTRCLGAVPADGTTASPWPRTRHSTRADGVGETHLRRVLHADVTYGHGSRPHQGYQQAPTGLPPAWNVWGGSGPRVATPVAGGLQHAYQRMAKADQTLPLAHG